MILSLLYLLHLFLSHAAIMFHLAGKDYLKGLNGMQSLAKKRKDSRGSGASRFAVQIHSVEKPEEWKAISIRQMMKDNVPSL